MSEDALGEALLAARLCAIDPSLGGMVLRGGGELRDRVIAELSHRLGFAPSRRLPPNIDDEALLGGVDLAATLAAGAPVRCTGLLAVVAGGVLVMPMAERLREATTARVAAALDGGEATRFIVAALDDGIAEDEYPPASLTDRLAFHLDLSSIRADHIEIHTAAETPPLSAIGLSHVTIDDNALTALTATAAALGIDSIRAALLALRAARAAAALDGRNAVSDADLVLAARLVLAPRATRVPASDPPTPPPPEAQDSDTDHTDPTPLDDLVLAAASAAIPHDLLARIAAGRHRAG